MQGGGKQIKGSVFDGNTAIFTIMQDGDNPRLHIAVSVFKSDRAVF